MIKPKWLAMILLVALVFSTAACTTQNTGTDNTPLVTDQKNTSASPADPYGKSAETIPISIGKEISTSVKFTNNETWDNNKYVNYINDKLNVKITDAFQSANDAYTQKANLAIASSELPDVLTVNYDQLRQLVEADQIEDLTRIYDKYASPFIKEQYASTKGESLKTATFKGKLMALPDTVVQGDAVNMVWIRKDWLDKLKLQAPKTLDDLVNIAQQFIKSNPGQQKDPIGIPLVGNTGNSTMFQTRNNTYGLDTIFSMYNAYPTMWIKDKSGNPVYGSIAPEAKTALAKIRELYEKGIFDKNFGIKKSDDANKLISSGNAGIMFAPWWNSWSLEDSLKNDPKADWQPYLAPLDANGKFNTHLAPASLNFLVVKKGFKHPEAIMRVLNLEYKLMRGVDGAPADMISTSSDWLMYPFSLQIDYSNGIEREYKEFQSVIDGKTKDAALRTDRRQDYTAIKYNSENPRKDPDKWATATARFTASGLLAKSEDSSQLNGVFGLYNGTTKTMELKWANLQKMETDAYMKIILGKESIDYFDQFVQDWKSQGGEQITKEVIEAINSK
jgi:putative aldouronate transport system substrate-binding protein